MLHAGEIVLPVVRARYRQRVVLHAQECERVVEGERVAERFNCSRAETIALHLQFQQTPVGFQHFSQVQTRLVAQVAARNIQAQQRRVLGKNPSDGSAGDLAEVT
jgi:hypothetical protein